MGREEGWKLVVPVEKREEMMYAAHCTSLSGHLGMDQTYHRIVRQCYWRDMYYDVENYMQECRVCQQCEVPQTGVQGLMGKRIVERPWVVAAADVMEWTNFNGGSREK